MPKRPEKLAGRDLYAELLYYSFIILINGLLGISSLFGLSSFFMFNKLKQFRDLRSQAKNLQNTLSDEKTTVSSNGVSLTMDGNLKIIGLDIPTELLNPDKKEKLQNAIKDAHNDAFKKMQKVMAMKVREMGGLPNIPGLS